MRFYFIGQAILIMTNMETSTSLALGINDSSLNSSNVPNHGKGNAILVYTMIPVVTVICVLSAIVMIMWALRRSRMDKLRQHLMPMYSIDPSDSGQEWEVDLLSQEVKLGLDSSSPHSSPTLKLTTMHSEL